MIHNFSSQYNPFLFAQLRLFQNFLDTYSLASYHWLVCPDRFERIGVSLTMPIEPSAERAADEISDLTVALSAACFRFQEGPLPRQLRLALYVS